MPADFRLRVLAVVKHLGPGQVASYGDVAAEAGFPGAARAVGAVLASPEDGDPVPWWRVVYADGRLSPGNERKQAQLLAAEGVQVRAGRVVSGSERPEGVQARAGRVVSGCERPAGVQVSAGRVVSGSERPEGLQVPAGRVESGSKRPEGVQVRAAARNVIKGSERPERPSAAAARNVIKGSERPRAAAARNAAPEPCAR